MNTERLIHMPQCSTIDLSALCNSSNSIWNTIESHRWVKLSCENIGMCLSYAPFTLVIRLIDSLTFRDLSKIIWQKYTKSKMTFIVRISSLDIVSVPKAWLWAHVQNFSEIPLRSTISAIHKFQANILESMWNVSNHPLLLIDMGTINLPNVISYPNPQLNIIEHIFDSWKRTLVLDYLIISWF